MGPRLLRASLALSLSLLAWVASAQPSCPDLVMNLMSTKATALGGTVTVKAKVRNVGAARQEGVAIGITLPDAVWSPLRPVATAVKQHGKWAVAATYQSPGVYWLPLSLPAAGKGAKVRVKARVAACPALVGTELAFTGVVYKMNATGQVLCATAATGRHTSTKVKPAKPSAKTLPPSACSSPTPAPGAPYVFVTENQQILGAEYVPFLGTRRRTLLEAVDGVGSAQADTRRELPLQQYTVQDCYQACSATGNYTVPFYMNFYQPPTGSASCYCSKSASRTLLVLGWSVWRIDVPAPQSQVRIDRTGPQSLLGGSIMGGPGVRVRSKKRLSVTACRQTILTTPFSGVHA